MELKAVSQCIISICMFLVAGKWVGLLVKEDIMLN